MTLREIAASAFAICSGIASAADYHVSLSGLDTNPGTQGQPWRTIQKAAATVVAGDTVHIHAGIYIERVTIENRHGSAALPIVFKKFAADTGSVIISQSGVTPPDDLTAVLAIRNCDHLVVRDLEIADYKTAGTAAEQRAQLPVGIHVSGSGTGIQIRGCKVHDIWQSSPTQNNYNANGFGIAVYGEQSSPIDQLVIDGCEVYNLRTGASESLVLNGNVTNFAVTNNIVRDCNNIGIDFIGFEGTNPVEALDQARNGICSGNVVFRIDSKFNPVYGGNFTTGGGNATRSAPGLYVDGGRDIILERNHVYDCNFAISIGSENTGKVVSGVTVRNNVFHHCHVGGIVVGGSETTNGGTTNSSFTHNTIYGNDTVSQGGGQFSIQNHVSGLTVRRNVMVSTSSFSQFILKGNNTGSVAAGAIDWNLYYAPPGGSFEFISNNTARTSFAAWQSASAQDTHSSLITTSPGFVGSTLTAASPAADFAITASSPAKDTGDSAALPFTPAANEKDYRGRSRIAGGRVDIGAFEFMTALQEWRDIHFTLPDGGPGAGSEEDPDGDGVSNLIEYSQGMNPVLADRSALPATTRTQDSLRFTYRKAVPGLSYAVESSGTLGSWSPALSPEQSDGLGLFWRDLPLSAGKQFIRLKVSSPETW
ncbi:hypothetical protein OJ996_18775 [Luteolibacter sp. GHJ8]|uniref:DUF1565 domain-containing protein n=1 Tax=Luteolibacter rhizosphaerae TaxID=2989719 RepID=A0ABT3G714_9BACT|nr:choice-of-anchor Q domain-containing protein [Luteolibacter rhizosphaerae]MCW1915637.1 hypothetical protein [Luteolibacter rhizosphaerae]